MFSLIICGSNIVNCTATFSTRPDARKSIKPRIPTKPDGRWIRPGRLVEPSRENGSIIGIGADLRRTAYVMSRHEIRPDQQHHKTCEIGNGATQQFCRRTGSASRPGILQRRCDQALVIGYGIKTGLLPIIGRIGAISKQLACFSCIFIYLEHFSFNLTRTEK